MNKAPNLLESMAMGMTAGAVGSFVGNPCELILIRMTADGRLPVAERRNYTNFFNAFLRIAREEGIWWIELDLQKIYVLFFSS